MYRIFNATERGVGRKLTETDKPGVFEVNRTLKARLGGQALPAGTRVTLGVANLSHDLADAGPEAAGQEGAPRHIGRVVIQRPGANHTETLHHEEVRQQGSDVSPSKFGLKALVRYLNDPTSVVEASSALAEEAQVALLARSDATLRAQPTPPMLVA